MSKQIDLGAIQTHDPTPYTNTPKIENDCLWEC